VVLVCLIISVVCVRACVCACESAGQNVSAHVIDYRATVKDRIALSMINDAEKSGRLRPGMRILEATSGNTGIGLAFIAAAKGYGCTLVMPDSMTLERRALLKAYGATLVMTPGPEGMKSAVAKAEEMAAQDSSFCYIRQFENPANPAMHERTTAVELLEQVPELDAFVAGVGTGGTVTGVSKVRYPVSLSRCDLAWSCLCP
jgi:cysteine synthase A